MSGASGADLSSPDGVGRDWLKGGTVDDEEGTQTRILFAEGQSLFRQVVIGVLEEERDLCVVAEAGEPADAIGRMDLTRPDVALLETSVTDQLGATIVRITDTAPECKVIVLAPSPDGAELVEALRAGASGYVTNEVTVEELIEVIRRVVRGEFVIPDQMIGSALAALLQGSDPRERARERLATLTRREREVLTMLAKGADKSAIAQELFISPQTVRTHAQNILHKLQVHSRLEAAAFARRYMPEDLVVAGRDAQIVDLPTTGTA